jgi:hypothetical protein
VQDGFAGTAVKHVAAPGGTGLGSSLINTIQIGERYHIELKGDRYLSKVRAEGGNFAVGDPVYIRTADNLLTATSNSGANPKFGRVTEIDDGGGRGALAVGSGLMVVNLDAKDGF